MPTFNKLPVVSNVNVLSAVNVLLPFVYGIAFVVKFLTIALPTFAVAFNFKLSVVTVLLVLSNAKLALPDNTFPLAKVTYVLVNVLELILLLAKIVPLTLRLPTVFELPIFASPPTASEVTVRLLEIAIPVVPLLVLIVCVPSLILEPLNHKSLHACPSAPKSYATSSDGIKSPTIDPTVNEPVMFAFAALATLPTSKSLVMFA